MKHNFLKLEADITITVELFSDIDRKLRSLQGNMNSTKILSEYGFDGIYKVIDRCDIQFPKLMACSYTLRLLNE